jgi:hypothetical protein
MLVNWQSDERRQVLTTVENYQQRAIYSVLDVIGMPLGWVIGSLIEV